MGASCWRRTRERVDAGADGVALAAPQNQPLAGQIVDRDEVREAALSRVEVTQAVLARLRDRGARRGDGPRPGPGAGRRDPSLRPPRGPALVPVRHPLRDDAQGPGGVGEAALRRPGHPHPRPDRGRRDPLGRDPHPGRRHADRRRRRPGRAPEGEGRRAASSLHVHQPTLRPAEPRGGLRAPRQHPGGALPLGDRRHRPADEPGAAGRDPERDRALPRRRGPDLDPRRGAVEVARGGADRPGPGDDRQARGARRGSGAPAPVDGACGESDGSARGSRRASRAARGASELPDRPPDARASCSSSSPR